MRKIYARVFQWLPLAAGIGCIALARLLMLVPEFSHSVYRNGMFSWYRWMHDGTLGYSPVPVLWFFIALIFAIHVYKWWRRTLFYYRPWYRGIFNGIGLIVVWFYAAWGFNYSATGVAEKLQLDQVALTGQMHTELFELAHERAVALRAESDTTRFTAEHPTTRELQVIHLSVRDALQSAGFTTPGFPRMRLISRTGWMRRLGVSGIYLPFSGECHADASYLPLRLWFTIAHEYAHGYGITDEGECNFIAFMALVNSGMPELEYAAWFELLDDLITASSKDLVAREILLDRRELRRNADRFPPIWPSIAAASNDLYLRSQGIEDGLSSYRSTPRLVGAAIAKGLLNVKNREDSPVQDQGSIFVPELH